MNDRTKAILEAAERFANAADLHFHEGADGSPYLSHDAIEIDDLRESVKATLLELVHALALPSPQWTRTPPSEPGYYWVRRTDGEGDQMEFLVLAMPQVNETRSLELGDGTMDLSDVLGPEWVWFPVRIEEPPA